MADIAPFALTNLSAASSAGVVGGNVVLNINGTLLNASQFSMTYGLNSIPTATVLVPLGRDARTGQQANAHKIAATLKQMTPVIVSMPGALGDWAPNKSKWPAGNHVLFIGYVAGTAYRRSLGRVSLVINMVNKLVDLTMSSAGSADVVPGAINDIMLPSSYYGAGGVVSATAGGKFVQQLAQDINVDFSRGLLKVIEYLCEENQLQIHEAWCGGDQGIAKEKRSNVTALNVLRASGAWRGIRNLAGGDAYTRNYPLQGTSNGRPFIAGWIGRRVAASLAGNSIWSMLIGSLIPSFGLYIIPVADSAYLSPVLPMCRTFGKVIKAGEYVDFDMKMMSQRPLYGVGVFSSYNLATLEKSGNSKLCVGATYTARSANGKTNDGMWLFTQAPGWMDGWVNYDPEVLNGNPGVVKLLNDPSHDATGVDKEAVNRSPSSEAENWNNVMRNYARMMYASNSLRGRSGSLIGKLRFDIAPGTTLLIEPRGDKAGMPDNLAVPLVGLVSSVTTTINGEQASATTSFEMTNVRSLAENMDDRMSMTSHPFFPSHFTYAPLVRTLSML